MDDILDEIEVRNTKKTFSILSLVNALSVIGLLGYFSTIFPTQIKASDYLIEPPVVLITAIQILCLTGVLFTVLTFVKKEPNSLIKWLGTILNTFIFFFILGLIIFAK